MESLGTYFHLLFKYFKGPCIITLGITTIAIVQSTFILAQSYSVRNSCRSVISILNHPISECRYCSRQFSLQRSRKHEKICSKLKPKRPVYDSKAHRLKGTDFEAFQPSKPSKSEHVYDWRKAHQETLDLIRLTRKTCLVMSNNKKKTLSEILEEAEMPENEDKRIVSFYCRFCKRKFTRSRIGVHENICSKRVEKRVLYDAFKHRVVGTVFESYIQNGGFEDKMSKYAVKKMV